MTRIKICGITNLVDAIGAVEAGADLLGFNFYPPSPRAISPLECAKITAVVRGQFPEVSLVGVFVNMPVEQMKAIMESCSLTYAQLHGDETPEILAEMQGRAYKAFRGIPRPEIINQFLRQAPPAPPAFLMDAAVQGLYGGSGITADWLAAANLAREYPMLLAGGLNPENVGAAITQVQPWGVDTASGVEFGPGRKDANKITAFVKAVRGATH